MKFKMSVNAMQKNDGPHAHAWIFYYVKTTHLMYKNYTANL